MSDSKCGYLGINQPSIQVTFFFPLKKIFEEIFTCLLLKIVAIE